MKTAIINGKIFTGTEYILDHTVIIDGMDIVQITHNNKVAGADKIVDLNGALLAPGFIDTQVNGGGDVLFNDNPCISTIKTIGSAHRKFGTCGFFPTLISDDLSKIKSAIDAVNEAVQMGVPGVMGIHIEGPFLNIEKKGIHDSDKFQNMHERHIPLLTSLKHGKTLITIAPEQTTPALVKSLTGKGVIVSIGHTNASYEATRGVLNAGASGFTHLFNAMSQFSNRKPGVVGAALEDSKSWCGLIIDGHHLSPTALNIALKCKPLDKLVIVTDAMPPAGSNSQNFSLQGKSIKVSGGACIADDGTLAGSNLTMIRAVNNAVSFGVERHSALNMAAKNPAEFLNIDSKFGSISMGRRANLVAISDSGAVLTTWINGEIDPELDISTHSL